MSNSKVCTVSGCDQPRWARSWCNRHYKRWRRHGDPLSGRIDHGTAAKFFNEVVLPYEGDDCLIWPYAKNNGYALVAVNGRIGSATRLVCEKVYGPPPTSKHTAAHSCGRGHEGCVSKRHLRWATYKENSDDQILHGTRIRGEHHGLAKLKENDVRTIRSLAGSFPKAQIGRRFGVSPSTVHLILKGKIWAWLDA